MAAPAATRPAVPRQAWVMLALATIGFAVNFWAWALISPLGVYFKGHLGLSSFQQAILVAVPVIVGSLGRIPVGGLTDRYGARVMFPLVSLVTILPVLFVGFVADSFAALIAGGFFLGLGGTAFAVGVPFVNAWFPPERRGAAIGIFGMGMGGTAISAFTTVKLKDAGGVGLPFGIVALVLAAYGVLAWLLLRDAPNRAQSGPGLWSRTWATMRTKAAIQASLLYAVGFGGFVAFSVYLPTYLKTQHSLSQSDAAMRTAGFVILAVIARPIGGWLSDRLQPVPVLAGCFGLLTVLASLSALQPPLAPLGTLAFLGMAAVLGAAAGAVFALVAIISPPGKVGAVTGVVGAAGGLGGFFPPLVMGAFYGWFSDYAPGLALLAGAAAVACAYTWLRMRSAAR